MLKKIVVVASLATALSLPVLADGNQSQQAGSSNQAGQSGPIVSNQGIPAPVVTQQGAAQVLQGEEAPAIAAEQSLPAPVASSQSQGLKNFFQNLSNKAKSLLSRLKNQVSQAASANQSAAVADDGAQGLPLPATGQQQSKPSTGQGASIPVQQSE